MEIMENESNLPAVKKEETFIDKTKQKVLSTSEKLGLAMTKRKEQMLETKKRVEESIALKPKGLDGKQVLYMPEAGYTRSLSIIEALRKLEEQVKGPLNKNYSVISGTGNSALIAVCLANGMSATEIKEMWLDKWINAYKVSLKDRLIRSLTVKKVYGFRVKKAREILEGIFSYGDKEKKLMTFDDLEEEVQLPAAFGRFKETEMYSKGNTPKETIVNALIDTVIDPNHFDAKETVEGKGTPLVIDDFEFNILLNNSAVLLTKVEAPSVHSDYGSLNNAGSSTLNKPINDFNNFNNKTNLDVFAKNFSPKRIKIVAKEIPGFIPKNSTDKDAIELAIEAGKTPKIIRY